MNEFIILLQTAAGAGWVFLVALGATAIGYLVFDRKPAQRAADRDQSARERRAA